MSQSFLAKTLLVFFVALIIAWVAPKIISFFRPVSLPLQEINSERERSDLTSLTLEQKVGQLFIVGIEDETLTAQTQALIKDFSPGGILLLKRNIKNPEQLKKLIGDLQKTALEATGLPLFVAVDQEGGLISRVDFLEEKTPQSEIKNEAEAHKIGLRRAQELKELGINLNLAPLLDSSQPGDFIFDRLFQKPSSQSGELAKALIEGQKAGGILTAIKHFPGYEGIAFNPEEQLAVVDKIPQTLQFQKAAGAGPELVMTANVVYQELDEHLPFTFSPKGIELLRNQLGQDILIISDDLSQNSLLNKFSLKEIVSLPVQAGVDILIFSGWRAPVEPAISALKEAAEQGKISQDRIDQAVEKIIRLKRGHL